jgi:hypothetical protein
MKKILTAITIVGLMSCSNDHEVKIMGTSVDYTQDIGFVSDSVFMSNQAIIDSLTTVEELLTHLSSLPTDSTSPLEGPDDTEHTWVGGNGESFKE